MLFRFAAMVLSLALCNACSTQSTPAFSDSLARELGGAAIFSPGFTAAIIMHSVTAGRTVDEKEGVVGAPSLGRELLRLLDRLGRLEQIVDPGDRRQNALLR